MQSLMPKISMLAQLCRTVMERGRVEDVGRLFQNEKLSIPHELSESILSSLAMTTQERICLCLGLEKFSESDVVKLQAVLRDEKTKLETTMGKDTLQAARTRNLQDMRDMVRHVVVANDLSILNENLKVETI